MFKISNCEHYSFNILFQVPPKKKEPPPPPAGEPQIYWVQSGTIIL
jgi:hypothetical protein